MVGSHSRRHAALTALLDDVGWPVSRLAYEVNREVGTGYVSRTTASEWVNTSRVPRQPLPTVVAHVLSQAAGRAVAPEQLWPGVATSLEWVPADAGTTVSWDLHGTKALINSWLPTGGSVFDGDRRSFMALSGAALTAPALQYVNQIRNVPAAGAFDQVLGSSGVSSSRVSPALVEYFQSMIGAFRRMDDIEGGSAENMKQLGSAIGQVTGYLKNGSFTHPGLARELTSALAQLGQVGGWMAYDADRHGLAQRYYRVGLQAAQNIGDRDLGAHILACMIYQAASRQQDREAQDLSDAAVRVSNSAHPLVKSVVAARVAHAQAVAGDRYGFRSATDRSAEFFDQAKVAGGGPEYLYWYDPYMTETVTGQSLVLLTLCDPRSASSQLEEAERLLAAEVDQTGSTRPRDAYYHGAWLARAMVKRGDLHKGLATAQRIIDSGSAVKSPRTLKVLGDLDKDLDNLREGRKLPEVRELRHQLRSVLVA
ncbi:MAG: hypothetical protein ACRDPW_10410 [Mycobacteriales bacterium]